MRQTFQNAIRTGKDVDKERDLDQWVERANMAKHNIEQVLLILQDFVNFDKDILHLQEKLEVFKNSDKTVVGAARAGDPNDGDDFDLLLFYRKIKIMQYLKNKM